MPRSRSSATDPDTRLFAALADPTRLAIVRQLAAERETCACDFTSCCDVGQPTVSHHLRVLRDAGVVTSERRGSWIFYRLADDLGARLDAITSELDPRADRPVVAAGELISAASLRRGTGEISAPA
jgi:DNA-binding transcriptional ArsR family regulator